jgi:hypothetical protein
MVNETKEMGYERVGGKQERRPTEEKNSRSRARGMKHMNWLCDRPTHTRWYWRLEDSVGVFTHGSWRSQPEASGDEERHCSEQSLGAHRFCVSSIRPCLCRNLQSVDSTSPSGIRYATIRPEANAKFMQVYALWKHSRTLCIAAYSMNQSQLHRLVQIKLISTRQLRYLLVFLLQ